MDEAEVKVRKFWGLITPREHDEWLALAKKVLLCTMSTPENPEALALKRKLEAMNLDFELRCKVMLTRKPTQEECHICNMLSNGPLLYCEPVACSVILPIIREMKR